MKIDEICSLTGHRPQKLPWGFNEKDKRCKKFKKILEKVFIDIIKNGYSCILIGMALGFDMICAEIVIKLKKKYKELKLIAVLPCKNQSDRWTEEDKIRYNKILEKVDSIYCLYEKYNYKCMQERNEFMVNNSNLLLGCFNGEKGGTLNTINYAKRKNKEIIIINPNDFK